MSVKHSDLSDVVPRLDSYAYDALPDQHFRLIRVVSRISGQISCEIKTCSRLQTPAYAALSYAWGEPPDTHFITIDGRRKAVRENLWHFLHDATTQDEWLWIDAVCINQDDLEERSQQVQMMASIFRLAERVYIWLGPATEGSDAAMQLVSRTTVSGEQVGQAFDSLTQRDYWSRLWVFQELLQSGRKILCCGSETAPFEAFRDLLASEADHEGNSDDPARSMLSMTRLEAQHNLLGLMTLTKHLGCADLHDRAFALLGVHPLGSRNISADYDMPISHLLNSILLCSHLEVGKPRSLADVAEQCQSLGLIFGQDDTIFQLHEHEKYPPVYELPAGDELSREVCCESMAWALYYGHTSVLELIIRQRRNEAYAWLWHAATQKNVHTARVLLHCGARLIVNECLKSTATLMERISSLKDQTMFNLFNEYNLMSVEQDDIARMAAAGLCGAAAGGNLDVLRFWLTQLAEVMPEEDYEPRMKALSAAQRSADYDAMETILDYRLQPECKPELGRLALCMAAEVGDLQLGEMSYSRGAHLTEHHDSFLSIAIKNGQRAFVEWALDKGIHVNEQIRDGHWRGTPVLLAADSFEDDIVGLLLARGADASSLGDLFVVYAARSGNIDALKMSVIRRSTVNKLFTYAQAWSDLYSLYRIGVQRCSVLAIACQYNQQEVMRFLLRNRADINAVSHAYGACTWRQCTPLYLAVESGSLGATELLLQAGADPRIAASHGFYSGTEPVEPWTWQNSIRDFPAHPQGLFHELHPIWTAARAGHTDLVEKLYQKWRSLPSAIHQLRGRTKSCKTSHTIGILYIAAVSGHIETVKLLLQLGAMEDPESVSICEHHLTISNGKQTWHALYVAAAKGNHAMVELLLDAGLAINDAEVFRFDEGQHVRAHAIRAAIKNGDAKMVELLKSYGAVDTSANVHLFKDSDADVGFWKAPLYIERYYVPTHSES